MASTNNNNDKNNNNNDNNLYFRRIKYLAQLHIFVNTDTDFQTFSVIIQSFIFFRWTCDVSDAIILREE